MKYFFIAILSIFCVTLLSQEKHPDVLPLDIGASAPDFNLRSVDGKMYSLADFKDKNLLVILFTCNHCPTAQAYEDKFIKIVNKYSSRGVGFVAISPNSNTALSLAECGYSDLDDSYESMIIRAKDKDFNFPYLYDGDDHAVSVQYGPQATPHAYVFDKDRKLRYRGRIDDTENPYIEPGTTDLINALSALLEGKDTVPATTKTFGCSIKWSWKNQWTEQLKKQWAEEPVNISEIDDEGISELISNFTENLRVVNFWATWCGPCIIEFPELVNIYRIYGGRSFEMVSVSTDKLANKDKVLAFLDKNDAAFMNYIYNKDKIYDMIELVDKDWQGTLPYTLVIEPGGKILYSHTGAIDPLELKKQIISYLGRYYADN